MAEARAPYDLTTAAHDYADWPGLPRQTVLICTHPRSGSTLLGEALYFAGGLGCPLEYFHPGFRPGLAARWGTTTLREHIRAAHRWRTDPGGTFGTKLFWRDVEQMAGELDPERFAAFGTLRPEDVPAETYRAIAVLLGPIFPNPRFVHLERRDRVRLAVSGMTATQTGIWRLIPDAATPSARADVDYDMARLDHHIATVDACHAHWRNFFAAIGAQPYTLSYEALTADYTATIAGLLRWLGSDAAVPPMRLQRQSGAANEALVLRYLRDRAARSAPGGMVEPQIHRHDEP